MVLALVLVLAGATLVAAVVPGPGRAWARSIALGAAILAPVGGAVVLIARVGREPGTWLLLLPLTILWLAWIDLRFGVGARLARPAARTKVDARAGHDDA